MRIKRMAMFISFITNAPFIAAAGQSSVSNVDIQRLTAYSLDLVFVKTSKASASTVSNCNPSGYTGEWVISVATESGKAMYSLLLSAAAQGKKVDIYGGSIGCNLIGNRETIVRVDVAY